MLLDVIRAARHGRQRKAPGEQVCDWLERTGCSESPLGGPVWAEGLGKEKA